MILIHKKNTFFENTNFKCYDFNKIFKNYIDIKSRTLFLNIDQKIHSTYIKIVNFLDLDQDIVSVKF